EMLLNQICADTHIVVEQDENLSLRLTDPGVARCGRAAALLPVVLQRIMQTEGRYRSFCVIRGSVIDHDYLVPGSRLLLIKVMKQPHELLPPIVGGNDDAKDWHGALRLLHYTIVAWKSNQPKSSDLVRMVLRQLAVQSSN